jgi:pimeloyl-ACP methyl ester carboxylesterase
VSGRDHLLRASTYYRTAEYYVDPATEAARHTGERSRECFTEAGSLFVPPLELVDVPFDGSMLPGYFLRPRATVAADPGRLPTLVCVGGFDSSAEELYFHYGVPGVERGWNVFAFDGPGQPGCMRLNPALPFRPDYEVPLAAVLDVICARDDVDPGRVALVGQSFGSCFAARSAATDPRVRALVANPPVIDMRRYMEAWVGSDVFGMSRDIRPEDVLGVPEDLMPKQMQWGIESICRRFGVPSFSAWRDVITEYRLGDLVGAITCPVLALIGDREGNEPLSQFDAFVGALPGQVSTRRFNADDGASTHCQSDNIRLLAQVVFDWLDERFA